MKKKRVRLGQSNKKTTFSSGNPFCLHESYVIKDTPYKMKVYGSASKIMGFTAEKRCTNCSYKVILFIPTSDIPKNYYLLQIPI